MLFYHFNFTETELNNPRFPIGPDSSNANDPRFAVLSRITQHGRMQNLPFATSAHWSTTAEKTFSPSTCPWCVTACSDRREKKSESKDQRRTRKRRGGSEEQ